MEQPTVFPSPQQVAWADCEIGVIIHQDLTTYLPDRYDIFAHFGDPPPVEVFAPTALDTDQWLAVAKSAGAKYAVLVAKHCTGFSLWPTDAHDYSVKNAPCSEDVVGAFIRSCQKYGLRPGIYCSLSYNLLYNVEHGAVRDGDPEKQKQYNEMCLRQLTELWTRYGRLFEIWFDGGVLPVEQGGPDVVGLLHRLQPDAVVFQGPPGTRSLLRWCGNERGIAAEDCTSLFRLQGRREEGITETGDFGDPEGDTSAPAESDTPNRDNARAYSTGWFWQPGEDDTVKPAEQLIDIYLSSVGRNSNLLLGMVIDNRGLCPDADTREFARFGAMVQATFGQPLAEAHPASPFTVEAPAGTAPGYAAIAEDIRQGERIRQYVLHGLDDAGQEIYTHAGRIIGHKRLLPLPDGVRRVTLEITQCHGEPQLRFLRLYPAAAHAC